MSILVTIVAASAPFLFRALQASAGLGTRQTAVSIATQRVDYVRGLAAATLETGRALADVQALNSSPGMVNLSQDALPTSSSDCLATPAECDGNASSPSSAATVPLTETETVKRTTYTIRTFVNVCYLSATGTCGAMQATSAPYYAPEYRVDVDVAWPATASAACASARPGYCEYTLSTLRDPSEDPTFSLNTDYPVVSGPVTTTPTAVHPGEQTTLSITGSSFVYATQVASQSVGDTVRNTTTNANGTGITATFTPGLTTATGTHSLAVINPDGTSTTTSVTVTPSAPSLSSIGSPANGGSVTTPTTQTFTLNGSDFYATPTLQPTVTFTATSGTVYTALNVHVVSSTQLTAALTYPGVNATLAGAFSVANPDVSNPSNPSSPSNSLAFTETLHT